MNILNITLVISPMGLFRWEKLKMRKHLKAQVCRQKSNVNEGNKDTSEKEWMMNFIANLICTLFLYIKKTLHKRSCAKLLDWCKKTIQLGRNRGSSKTNLLLSSCCAIVIFKYLQKAYVRTATLREYMLHLYHVVSRLCQTMAGARVVVIFCCQSSGCSLKILKSLGPAPELFYPLLPIVFFWYLIK